MKNIEYEKLKEDFLTYIKENEEQIHKIEGFQNNKIKFISEIKLLNSSLESKDNLIIKYREEIELLNNEVTYVKKNVSFFRVNLV